MNQYVPMIDAALVLQAPATQTATTNCPWLDLGQGFEPANLGELIGGVVKITAIDRTTGDETYGFKLQQSNPVWPTTTTKEKCPKMGHFQRRDRDSNPGTG